MILCKEKKALTVEYALRNTATPIGVSEYVLTESLPEELKSNLPSVQQFEAEMAQRDSAALSLELAPEEQA